MSTISRYLSLAITGFVLVSFLQLTESGPVKKPKVETDKVQLVMDKLEAFVANGRRSSGVTIDELRAAFEQSNLWDVKTFDKLRHSTPLFRLMADFVLTPMDKFNDLVKHDWKNKDVKRLCEDYISRLESAYKTVRPLYLGKTIWHNFIIVAHKIDEGARSLAKLSIGAPLTKKILMYAKEEYDAYWDRLDDIATNEDIFFKMDELIKIYNMLNRPETKIMAEEIFPILDKLNSQKALDDASKLYKDKLEKANIFVRNGILIK